MSDKRSAFAHHVLPNLGKRTLAEISRREWVQLVDELYDKPGIRRCLHAYLHHFLRWAVEREMLPTNPLQGVRPPGPVTPRERVLSDDEIRELWVEDGVIADLARLALLTAQRRSTLSSMRWNNLDLQKGEWSIPGAEMKSSRPHTVPLSPTALAIIRARPTLAGPYVFGIGSEGNKPFSGFSKAMKKLRQPDAITEEDLPWRFHDLRRTSVTLAKRAGASLDTIRALTQHKTSGIIGVHARHDFSEEKRSLVVAIERQLLNIVSRKR